MIIFDHITQYFTHYMLMKILLWSAR